MASKKIYYLSSEVAPFSETYELATFSRKITNLLHLKDEIDIRVSQPKYGFVSERKYILREVIRLKDLSIIFGNKKHIINMKSAFIPETRVQVYFLENNSLYKELPELIYKARNGRVFSDLDLRYSFFCKSSLDTLQSLFWVPDIIVCNDWQTSLTPVLVKQIYKKEKFYSKIKTIYIIHSLNDLSSFSKSIYESLNLTKSNNKIDTHIQGIENSDMTIVLNYEANKILENMKKKKDLIKTLEANKHLIIDIPGKPDRELWKTIANTIENICKEL